MSSNDKHARWYLVAYDIADPRRLQKVRYRLDQRAFAMQHSVFLLRADTNELKRLQRLLHDLTDARYDDVRLYPIESPNTLWITQGQGERLQGLYPARQRLPAFRPWLARLQRLFTRERR